MALRPFSLPCTTLRSEYLTRDAPPWELSRSVSDLGCRNRPSFSSLVALLSPLSPRSPYSITLPLSHNGAPKLEQRLAQFPAHSAHRLYEPQKLRVLNEPQATLPPDFTNSSYYDFVPAVNIDVANTDCGTPPYGRHPYHWEENIAASNQVLAHNAENLGEFVVDNGALHSPTDFQTLNISSNLELGPGNSINNATPNYVAQPNVYNDFNREAAVLRPGSLDSRNLENGSGYTSGNRDSIFIFPENTDQSTTDNGSFNNAHLSPTWLDNLSIGNDSYAVASGDDIVSLSGGHQPSNNYELGCPMSSFGKHNFGQHVPAPSLNLEQTIDFDPTALMFDFDPEILGQQTTRPPSNLITSSSRDLPSTTQPTAIALVPQPTARTTLNPTSHQFGCGHCGRRFKRKGDCDRHRKTHAPPHLRCVAPGCLKAFNREDKRAEHQRRIHGM